MPATSTPVPTGPPAQVDSDQILDIALASTGAGVVVIGPDLRVTRMTEVAARVTGWTEVDALGRGAEEVFGSDGRHVDPALLATLRGLFVNDASPTLRQRVVVTSRLGTRTNVELSTARMAADGGGLRAFVVVLRDLKRLIDVEARTRSAEARFRLVMEMAPNGLLIADERGAITLANHNVEAMFGYSPGELVGQPIELLVPERARSDHPGHLQSLFSQPAARAMGSGRDLFGRRKDGTEVPVEIGLKPLQTPEGLFMLASVIDITERKRRDDELRRSNADLEQFAYIASHDLQEPLRMVASYTELLGERYKGRLDERADKYIFYAVDGAKRMQRLVADLLAFSRVGSQGKALQPVDAGPVLDHVLHVLGPSIAQAGATVASGPLPRVLADEGQLHQLLQNLVGNAIKFRAEAAPVVTVEARLESERWVFTVRDNGIGIDLRYADRIFQMFQRLHERGRYEGSGIGLAIAKRIVERHGGTIWLESQPGAGTAFHFTLAAVPASEAAAWRGRPG
jgi:PAS domain S-box-containing protein